MKPQDTSPTRIAAAPPVINPTLRESKPAELSIAFPDNAAASVVFGHYDQNIARIERSLGVSAYANGNQVVIKGPREASEQARRVFEMLYERVKLGQPASEGDVEGVIAESAYQGLLFPGEDGVQGKFRRRQDAQARRCARPQRGAGPLSRARCANLSWCSPKDRPAPARPGLRSATPSRCSNRGWSNGWCCRVPRSRLASGSASCPAT